MIPNNTRRLRSYSPIKISPINLFIGVVLGIAYAIVLYAFLYMIREALRIGSITSKYDLWVLSEEEVAFYNFFLAFIAVIFGQSIGIKFCLHRPKAFFQPPNHRIISIVHDQNVLNWYFLSWFSKLSLVFALSIRITFPNGYYAFSFYPTYSYIFTMIIIVLFLQTWNTIRLTYRKSFKWMFMAFILSTAFAFGLSKINWLNYQKINHAVLQKNINYFHKLELPQTNHYEQLPKPSLVREIYIVQEETRRRIQNFILADDKKVRLTELQQQIKYWQFAQNSRAEVFQMVYRLHIDQDTDIAFFYQVVDELNQVTPIKIAYAVTPMHPEYDKRYYQNCSFPSHLPNWEADLKELKKVLQNPAKRKGLIIIKPIITGDYLVNGTLVTVEQLQAKMTNLIVQNKDYTIVLPFDAYINFGQYFNVLSITKQAILNIREAYAQQEYKQTFKELDYDKQIKIRQAYPFYLFEIKKELDIETIIK